MRLIDVVECRDMFDPDGVGHPRLMDIVLDILELFKRETQAGPACAIFDWRSALFRRFEEKLTFVKQHTFLVGSAKRMTIVSGQSVSMDEGRECILLKYQLTPDTGVYKLASQGPTASGHCH